MTTYKHIKTGELMTYKSGCMYVGKTVIEGTPDTNYWKEVTEVVEIPVGTKVIDTEEPTLEFIKEAYGWSTHIDETEIGEGKRFRIVKEPIEKDYEILSFVGVVDGTIYSKNNYGLFTNGIVVRSIEQNLKNKPKLIHSAKNSNGEIITIGDMVTNPAGLSFVISNFYFDTEGKKLLCNGKHTGNGHISINKVKKVIEPLFVTEDGVKIFKWGTKLSWVIRGEYKYDLEVSKLNYEICLLRYKSVYKVFSTPEAAEQYVLMHKPCLSIQDIVDNEENNDNIHFDQSSMYQRLVKLVKSKL